MNGTSVARFRLLIATAVVLVLAVTATIVVIDLLNPTVTSGLHDADVDVTVSARATSGTRLIVTRLPQGDEPTELTALGSAIHVDVQGGELRGTTSLVFQLSAPLPPDAVAVVATRLENSQWRTIAADYDPAGRTISITAGHFSDWVPGAVDKDQIERDLELQKRRDATTGGGIARTIAGSTPALGCVGRGPLVSVFVDDATNLVKTCMQVAGPGQPWHLEIVNGHAVPFEMTLPSAVRAVPRDDGLQSLPNFVATYYEKQNPGKVILPAESKRVFDVDPSGIGESVDLHGSVEWSLLTFQLALFTINLAAKTDASATLNGAEEVDHWYKTLDDVKGLFDCSAKSADSVQKAVLSGDSRKLLGAVGDIVKACKDSVLSEWSNRVSGELGVAVSNVKNLVTSRLNLITELGDTVAGVRSVMEGTVAGLAALRAALPGKAEALDIGVRLTKIVRPVPIGIPPCTSYRVPGDFADLIVTSAVPGTLHWAIDIHYVDAGRWDVETYLDGEATGSNFHQTTNALASIHGDVATEEHQIFKIGAQFQSSNGVFGSRNYPNACYAP